MSKFAELKQNVMDIIDKRNEVYASLPTTEESRKADRDFMVMLGWIVCKALEELEKQDD